MAVPNLREVADQFTRRITELRPLVDQIVQGIPSGQVTTYGEIAKSLGDTVASRWVATYLLDTKCPVAKSSHRVIRSTGEVGLYSLGDSHEKSLRLQEEGIAVASGKVNLSQFQWQMPPRSAPLAELKRWQREFHCPQRRPLRITDVHTIAGIDVSYAGQSAVSACSRVEMDGRTLLSTETYVDQAKFPYITGYLAFREIPVHLSMLAEMQQKDILPDILLVDGNGKLHPRRMGIATMLGALAGIPTIGVAKKLICGVVLAPELRVGSWEPIIASKNNPEDVLGYAIRPHEKTKHPIYVSAGFGVDDEVMKTIVERCLAGHRSPEPIYWADRISRQHASTIVA
ncbi:endonuclease V [Bremerella sp. T1]|uniref:endonuclease V n=1 Tax=Bremerella sp. TYQ1 TaxID=3119568 RepID=UPI001CCFA427|nr:endonuclease V [Bremerella volcania]UBM35720.1 endonuclease V [Bremerella volcania]